MSLRKGKVKQPQHYNTEEDDDQNKKMVSSNIGTTATSTSASAISEFDALRREATKLERHLEDRVAKYQQVCAPIYSHEMYSLRTILCSGNLCSFIASTKIYNRFCFRLK